MLHTVRSSVPSAVTLSCGNMPLNGNGAGSTILLLTSTMSPQRLSVPCEDGKEPKTGDVFEMSDFSLISRSLWENPKIHVQDMWQKSHEMEYPPVIKYGNGKYTI